jgi:hypothetical protein
MLTYKISTNYNSYGSFLVHEIPYVLSDGVTWEGARGRWRVHGLDKDTE